MHFSVIVYHLHKQLTTPIFVYYRIYFEWVAYKIFTEQKTFVRMRIISTHSDDIYGNNRLEIWFTVHIAIFFDTSLNKIFEHDLSFSLIPNISFLEKKTLDKF